MGGGSLLNDKSAGLQVEEDIGFERKEWKVERIAWLVMLLVVLAATAGLFGNGLLSRTTKSTSDGQLEIAYQRFARSGGRTTLEVTVAPGVSQEDEVKVLVSRGYLSRFQIRQVTPEPDSAESSGDSLAFVFKVGDSRSPLEVEFNLEAEAAGRTRGTVAVGEGPALRFSQFVYP